MRAVASSISIGREKGLKGTERVEWLQREGFLNGRAAPSKTFTIVEVYDYCSETAELLFQVCRLEPKDFRQRRKPRANDPPEKIKNGWVWSVKGVRQVPYRLPELQDVLDRVVCIVEGEKDATDCARGVPATTNAGGAGKWHDELCRTSRTPTSSSFRIAIRRRRTQRPVRRCFIRMAGRSYLGRIMPRRSPQALTGVARVFVSWNCGATGRRCR